MNDAAPVRGSSDPSADLPGRPGWCVRSRMRASARRPPSCARSSTLASPPAHEILRISALGLYRAFINGVRVGNDLLTPGWTSYDKRLSYQTYEVGPLLRQGQNVIDIWLADGWYRSQMMWAKNPILNTWGSEIAAIAELRHDAGPRAAVMLKTDDSWTSGELPVRQVRHLFRRDLRCPAGSARCRQRQRGDHLRHRPAGARTRSRRCASSSPSLPSSPGRMPRSGRSTISARTLQAMSPSP